MSTNKTDKSQLDVAQQFRTSYQPDTNTHRVDAVNVDYNSTVYTYNPDGSIDTIQYLYDSECEVTNVVTVADVSGSLDGTSFSVYAGKDSLQYIIWYNVDSGTPAPSDTASIKYIETAIVTDDPAAVIALATKNAILAHITGSVDLIPVASGATLVITAALRGATTDSSNVDAGFAVSTTTQGLTEVVDTARITYDANGNIVSIITDSGENIIDEPVKNIRNINHLRDNISIRDVDGDELEVNADGSINAVVTATDLDIRDLDATQDNVAISDGTDTMAVNTDGSINVAVNSAELQAAQQMMQFILSGTLPTSVYNKIVAAVASPAYEYTFSYNGVTQFIIDIVDPLADSVSTVTDVSTLVLLEDGLGSISLEDGSELLLEG